MSSSDDDDELDAQIKSKEQVNDPMDEDESGNFIFIVVYKFAYCRR